MRRNLIGRQACFDESKYGCDLLDSRVFSRNIFKSNGVLIPCSVASSKYLGFWENSRKLYKLQTASRVCITVLHSPKLLGVWCYVNTKKCCYQSTDKFFHCIFASFNKLCFKIVFDSIKCARKVKTQHGNMPQKGNAIKSKKHFKISTPSQNTYSRVA